MKFKLSKCFSKGVRFFLLLLIVIWGIAMIVYLINDRINIEKRIAHDKRVATVFGMCYGVNYQKTGSLSDNTIKECLDFSEEYSKDDLISYYSFDEFNNKIRIRNLKAEINDLKEQNNELQEKNKELLNSDNAYIGDWCRNDIAEVDIKPIRNYALTGDEIKYPCMMNRRDLVEENKKLKTAVKDYEFCSSGWQNIVLQTNCEANSNFKLYVNGLKAFDIPNSIKTISAWYNFKMRWMEEIMAWNKTIDVYPEQKKEVECFDVDSVCEVTNTDEPDISYYTFCPKQLTERKDTNIYGYSKEWWYNSGTGRNYTDYLQYYDETGKYLYPYDLNEELVILQNGDIFAEYKDNGIWQEWNLVDPFLPNDSYSINGVIFRR